MSFENNINANYSADWRVNATLCSANRRRLGLGCLPCRHWYGHRTPSRPPSEMFRVRHATDSQQRTSRTPPVAFLRGGEPRRPCPEIPADHHFTRYNAGAHRWYPNKLCGSPPLYAPCKLTFDLLILKVVSESRVTWAISVPILVFLGLSVLDLGPMYATDRQTSDAHHRLMPPTPGAGA